MPECSRRYTTYERSDEIPYMVVKRDGRREKFDRQKILEGLLKACEKRPIPMAKLAEVVDDIESKLADNPERELPTTEIGELLMQQLGVWIKLLMSVLRLFTGTSRMWRPFWRS